NFAYVGTDIFQYRVCDTFPPTVSGCAQLVAGCDTATVTVLIQPNPLLVDDFPIASDDNNTTPEDSPVFGSASGNDAPSLDGGNTYVLLGNPAHGTVT